MEITTMKRNCSDREERKQSYPCSGKKDFCQHQWRLVEVTNNKHEKVNIMECVFCKERFHYKILKV